jgi:transketolase
LRRGAYVLQTSSGRPDIIFIASGSEVTVCLAAAGQLAEENISVRTVSMPSWELFEGQDEAYRQTVLPPGVPCLAVEAGCGQGWQKYAAQTVTIDRFGASAPAQVLQRELGFTAGNVAEQARRLLAVKKA